VYLATERVGNNKMVVSRVGVMVQEFVVVQQPVPKVVFMCREQAWPQRIGLQLRWPNPFSRVCVAE